MNLLPVEIEFLSHFYYLDSNKHLTLPEQLTSFVKDQHKMYPKVKPDELIQKINGSSADDLNELIQLIQLYKKFSKKTLG